MRLRKLVVATLTIACLPVAGAAAQTAPLPSAGGLAELTDPSACALPPNSLDENGVAQTGCRTLTPLLGPSVVTASADGRFLYVAGGTDATSIFGHGNGYGGLLVLARDPASGALTRVQCLSSDESDGAGAGGCDPLTAGVDITDVALSADGTAVAVVASGSGALTLLSRDPATGRLTEVGCAQESVPYGGKCYSAPSLEGVSSVVFSPDGKDVYAASPFRSAVLQLRVADDGTLTRHCLSSDGSAGSCGRAPQLVGPGTLRMSGDGKTLYALTATGAAWLTRDTTTGALSQGGCLVPETGAPCGTGHGTASRDVAPTTGRGLDVSPDGNTMLVTAGYYDTAQLTTLHRADDGSLAKVACLTQTPYEEPDDTGDDNTGDDGDTSEDAVDTSDDAADTRSASVRQAPACAQAPVVPVGGAVAALSDGRFLVTGYGVAAVIAAGADGTLREDGCLATDDNRCVATKLAGTAAGATGLPGGGAVLVGGSISQLTAAPMATARAVGRSVRVRLSCLPTSACGGTATVDPLGANLRAPVRAAAAGAARVDVAAGKRATYALALPAGTRRAAATLTIRAGHRTLRILAPVSGLRGVGAPAAPAKCPSGTVVTRSATAKVVRRRDGATFGCLAGARPVRLDRVGGKVVTGPVRLAGRFAAVVLRSAAGAGRVHAAVAVVDLRHDRVLRLSDAAGQPVGSAVAALVLKPSGAVAWTACAAPRTGRCAGGRGDELHTDDAHGSRTVVVASHRIAALSLDGSELRFQVAGTPRTAPLA